MKHRWTRALVAAACTAMAAQAQAQAEPPAVLPPTGTVEQVLSQLPQVRAAAAGIALAQARSQRLQAGPHDWVAKAGTDRRRDQVGGRFMETEVALETGMRWPAKVAADRQLGTMEMQLGQLGHADAWHEAARALLADWFDALRDTRTAELLEEQARLMARQLALTRRRVETGDAAALELLAAQAEEARVQALRTRAQAQARLRRQTLLRHYPGLPDPADWLTAQSTPWPASAQDGDATLWVERILDDNHELERAHARAELARLQAQRTQQEQRPDPTLGVRATRERSGQERVLGIYVSLPLGGAGRAADARMAQAQAEVAEQEWAQTRQRVEADAWRTASEAGQAQATLAQQRRALEQVRQSADLQARAYALGESPLSDLLLAQRSTLDARLAAETAAFDAMQASARLLLDAHQLWAPPGH